VRYISGGVGGGQDITMEWLLANLDLEVTKVPAADRDAAMAAVGAGEGDVTLTQPDVALPAEETGRADVILATSEEVPAEWTDNEGVVSAKDFADLGLPEGTTWGAVLGLLVPSQVNELHQRWLYALFEAASEAPAYQARADSIPGLQIRLYSTEEANELARATYESTEPIIRELGLHHEDS
jgi:tripartite-type tricarboxylate transporter receptor subunit TctC